jgi:opacity protein-like surface antigen
MRKHFIATATLVAALGSGPALAVDNGIYIGASVGESGVEFDGNDGFNVDDSDTGYKLNAGWRVLDWFAVEANYIDFGKTKGDFVGETTLEFEADGINFSALGFIPIGPVDLFARAGFISWNADAKLPEFDQSASDDGMDFSYGAGAQFRVWSLTLRAEYEVFDIADADNLDMVSVGIMWTFL